MLFVAACAVYFYGLGAMPLVGPDEPRYAQVAREMYARGDLVTPTLGGHTWFEKPALLYWLMIGAYALFGVTEFAARVGPALSGLLCVALVGWTARRVEREAGPDAGPLGVTCAAVFASCAGLVVFSRGASFDIILTFTVTLRRVFLRRGFAKDARRGILLAGFYARRLSLFLKSVGIVLPAASCPIRPDAQVADPLRIASWGARRSRGVAALWTGLSGAALCTFSRVFLQPTSRARPSNNIHPHPVYFSFHLALPRCRALSCRGGKFWRRNSARTTEAYSHVRARVAPCPWRSSRCRLHLRATAARVAGAALLAVLQSRAFSSRGDARRSGARRALSRSSSASRRRLRYAGAGPIGLRRRVTAPAGGGGRRRSVGRRGEVF